MAIVNELNEAIGWYSNPTNFSQELEWMEGWLGEKSVEEPERVSMFLDVIPSIRYGQIEDHVRTRANTMLIEYALLHHDVAKRVRKAGDEADYHHHESRKKQILELCGFVNPHGIKRRR
jgi:hypothetical protein